MTPAIANHDNIMPEAAKCVRKLYRPRFASAERVVKRRLVKLHRHRVENQNFHGANSFPDSLALMNAAISSVDGNGIYPNPM